MPQTLQTYFHLYLCFILAPSLETFATEEERRWRSTYLVSTLNNHTLTNVYIFISKQIFESFEDGQQTVVRLYWLYTFRCKNVPHFVPNLCLRVNLFQRKFLFVVFKDKNTPSPFVENFPEDDGEAARAALPDHIYMDAMGFGMGNCCLQVLQTLYLTHK